MDVLVIILFFIIIDVFIAIFVALKAKKNGQNPFFWGIFTFITPIIGIFVYLILKTSWKSQVRSGNGFYCLKCGLANDSSSINCKNCKSQLSQRMNSDPSFIQPFSKHKYCISCGAKNPPNNQFCGECGKQL